MDVSLAGPTIRRLWVGEERETGHGIRESERSLAFLPTEPGRLDGVGSSCSQSKGPTTPETGANAWAGDPLMVLTAVCSPVWIATESRQDLRGVL